MANKRMEIVNYIIENADEDGLLIASVRDIEKATNISHRTITLTFKKLQEENLMTKIKPCVYQLEPSLLRISKNMSMIKKIY